jgi:hypothetical protein
MSTDAADTTDTTANQSPAVGSSFSLGWLMAQLFGPLQHRPETETNTHLPTISELDEASRMDLAFTELDDLLEPYPEQTSKPLRDAWGVKGHPGFTAAVETMHLALLKQLATDRSQLSAYQLGRALSDTCWLPNKDEGTTFLDQFNRHRLATLQSWLARASQVLPEESASTVSRSLQTWQDWADANQNTIKNNWNTAYESVLAALHTQAAAWHAQLAGPTDTRGQTSVDAWIHAAQSVVRTAWALISSILRRYWPIVIVIAAAVGGLLYLAIDKSSGTAKVWTSLVTVAAALGLSGASLRAAALKATSTIEQDIRAAAILDAQAWAITWLPTLPQSPLQRYRLASRGVAIPQSGKRLGISSQERAVIESGRTKRAISSAANDK